MGGAPLMDDFSDASFLKVTECNAQQQTSAQMEQHFTTGINRILSQIIY